VAGSWAGNQIHGIEEYKNFVKGNRRSVAFGLCPGGLGVYVR
jgi:hypothetical protein